MAFDLDIDLLFLMLEKKKDMVKMFTKKIKWRNSEPLCMMLDIKVNIAKYICNFEYEDLKLFIDKWQRVN